MPDARRSVSFPRHGGSRNTKDLPGRTQLTRSLAATRGHDPSSTRGGHLRQRTNPVLIPLSRKSASGTTAPRVFKAILLAAATSVAPFNLPLRPGADKRPAGAAKMRVRPAAFVRESVCHPLPPPAAAASSHSAPPSSLWPKARDLLGVQSIWRHAGPGAATPSEID